jgi:hypothetical protein
LSKLPQQIIDAAKGKIDEEVLSAAFAKPRGSTTAASGAGVAVSEIGARWTGKQRKGAAEAGIQLGNPGAVALTATSLVTMKVSVSLGGQIKEVKEILSTVPLADVNSVEVSRMGLGGVMRITSGESSFKLEGRVGDMREFAAAFDRAKAAA